MRLSKRLVLGCVLLLAISAILPALAYAAGTIEFEFFGTEPPPAELGGYPLTAVADPGFAEAQVVTVIPSFAGDITLSTAEGVNVTAQFVPDGGWSTWSQNYEGIVYYVRGETVTITLPEDVRAFLVYIEPNVFDPIYVSVQANDGNWYDEEIEGESSAGGFGFYTTGDLAIEQIVIQVPATAEGFAFGQIHLFQGEYLEPEPEPTPEPEPEPDPDIVVPEPTEPVLPQTADVASFATLALLGASSIAPIAISLKVGRKEN